MGGHLLVIVGHGECEVEEHLHGGQHHRTIRGAQPVVQGIHDVIHLLLALWDISAHEVQNLALCPLRELLHASCATLSTKELMITPAPDDRTSSSGCKQL